MSIVPQTIGDLIPPDIQLVRRATSLDAVKVCADERSVSIAIGAMILGEVVHHVQKSDPSTTTSYDSLNERRSDIGVLVVFRPPCHAHVVKHHSGMDARYGRLVL